MPQKTSLRRKRIRLSRNDYVGKRSYFLTLCCQGRRPLLRDPQVVAWLIDTLRSSAAARQFRVHAYCVMPDHVHLLVESSTEASDLPGFVGAFKQKTAYQWAAKHNQILWQTKFYDHILRRETAMDSVAWYIWMNPVRKGLCHSPEDYPYSGSFTVEGPWVKRPAEQWTPPWKNPLDAQHL